MSSEYKIKGRQRSKPAKPYERRTGIVKRMKDWLPALPSWLNWNTTTDGSDNSGASSTTATRSASERGLPSSTSFVHPQVSFTQSMNTRSGSVHSPSLPIKLPSLLQNNTKHSPLSTSELGLSRRLFESTTVSVTEGSSGLRIGGLSSQGNSVIGSEQEQLNSLNESERSWVAEDIEDGRTVNILPQVSPRPRPIDVGLSTPLSRTPLNVVESDTMEYEIGEGKLEIAPESTVVVSSAARSEHTVERVANLALLNMNSIRTPINSILSKRKVTSSTNSNLDRGLYSAHPLVTSTPQLSPVHEERSENMEQPEPSVTQSQSQVSDSNSSGRQFHPKTPMPGSTLSTFIKTPSSSKLCTEESIKRSPFHSPFYSGRTSFGGAASHQTLRTKRPRTESSPPTLAPMRLSITARSLSSDSRGGYHQLVASRTAKRILTTLESLNSPLSDARKLPMRALPGEHQTSKRRRMSDIPSSGAGILSPPPITPLHTPAYSSRRPRSDDHTQIVPNEKTARTCTKQSPLQEFVTLQKRNDSPKQTVSSSSHGSQSFTVPQFNTKEPPKQSSILAGLQFTPAPPRQPADAQGSPDKTPSTSPLKMTTTVPASSGLSGFKPLFHGGTFSGAGGGGKMRAAKRTHQHFHRESDEDVVVNPHAPPPSVGLSLGKDGSLPQFSFHIQLAKSKTPSLTASTTLSALSSVSPTPSTAGYSFSLPKAIDSHPSIPLNTHQKTTFDFSAPATCTPLSSALAPPSTVPSSLPSMSILSQPSNKMTSDRHSNRVLIKPPQNAGTCGGVYRVELAKQPPPLKNMSVEEALKKPEYQLPKLKPISQTKPPAQASECIVLTDSDDELTRTQPKKQTADDSSGSGLQLEAGKIGAGLQLPSSGIQPASKNSLLSSAAPLKALPQFAPPSNSWSCDTCMVSNKAGDDKCVACSVKKPNSVKPASSFSSLAGGLKLGGNLSIPKSNQSSKSDSQTFQLLPKFTSPSGSWTCDTCMISNKAEDSKCVACSASKPGSVNKTAATSATKTPPTLTIGGTGGLKLGGSLLAAKTAQSFKPDTQTFQLLSKFAPPSGSWTCDTCMISNKAEDDKCVACSVSKPGSAKSSSSTPSQSAPSSSSTANSGPLVFKPLNQFAPPAGSWSCDTCMVNNKAEDNSCAACSSPKPGAKTDFTNSNQGIKPTGGLALGGGLKLGSGIMLGGPAQGGKPSGGMTLGSGLSLGGGFKLGAGVSLGGPSQSAAAQNTSGGLKLGSLVSFKGTTSEEKKTSAETSTNNTQTKPISFSIQQPVSQFTNDTPNTAISTQSAPPPQFVLNSSAPQVTQTTSSTLQFNFTTSSSATSGFTLGNTSTVTASSGISGARPTFNPPLVMKNPLAGIKLGGMLQSSSVPNLGATLSLGGQGLAPSTSSVTQNILTGVTTSSSNNQGFQFSALPSFGNTTTSSQMTTGSVPTFKFSAGKQVNNGNSAGANSLFVFSGTKDSGSPFPTAGSTGGLGVFGSGVGTAGSKQPIMNFGLAQQNTTTSLFGSGPGQSSGNKETSQPQGIVLDQQHTGTIFNSQPKKPTLYGNQPQTQMQQQQQQQNTATPMFGFHAAGSSGGMFGTDQASLKMTSSNYGAASGDSGLSLTPQIKLGGSGLGSGLSFGTNNAPSMFTSKQTTTENKSDAVPSSSTGFNFNTSAGLNLNFGGGGGGGSGESGNGAGGVPSFMAGSQGTMTSRIFKKAKRRGNAK